MNASTSSTSQIGKARAASNQNIQVYVRARPLNERERCIRSNEVVSVVSSREIIARHALDAKLSKKFTFDRAFGPESRQLAVYNAVVAPLIEEVLAGYNCTVFAYGQTGTGKTHTMIGNELANCSSTWDDNSEIGIIPRALCHLFDELRMIEAQFTMRVSYLELYNEELCDLLSTDDNNAKIRIFDDSTKKGSVIINGLEEVPVQTKNDVYKLLEKGQQRRKTAKTLMNAQSSRSHTVFSILVHMRETDMNNEEMVKIGKLNLVDLAGSENVTKAGNEKPIRVRETVNINQSLLTLGRVITALVERTPHIPYRESKLTRLLQESLGGRTKTAIIATISPGHKDIEETLSTLEYAHRAKNIQNKPELNQKLSQRAVLIQYTEEIDKLKRDLMAVREKNGIYLPDETFYEMTSKMDAQSREINEKVLLLKALKDELSNKEKIFNEISLKLIDETTAHMNTQTTLSRAENDLMEIKKAYRKTKLRYEENKMLLTEHMKTEEVLTTQAAEILAVANIATDDTDKLQSTIERRKNIDEKIKTASDRLLDIVNDNLNRMDEHIGAFRNDNANIIELATTSIQSSIALHAARQQETNAKISNVKEYFENKMQHIIDLQRQQHADMRKMNANYNEEQVAHNAEILQQTNDFAKEIQKNLQILYEKSQQEHNDLSELSKQVQNINNYRNVANDTYVCFLTEMLTNARQIICKKNEINLQLEQQLQTEKQLQNKAKSMLAELNAIFQCSELHKLDAHIEGIRETDNNCDKLFENFATKGNEYCDKMAESNKKALESNSEYIASRRDTVQQQHAQIQEIVEKVDNFAGESKLHLHNAASATGEFVVAKDKHEQKALTDLQEQLTKCGVDLSEMHAVLETFLQESNKALVEKQEMTGNILLSVDNNVWEKLQKQYANLRAYCLQNITEIKQTELQPYQPTGMTPGKREFSYPRALKNTSPHKKLIERFRLQRNENANDDTPTVLEDSFGEAAEETATLQNLEEHILNSTPIECIENKQQQQAEHIIQSENLLVSCENLLVSCENLETQKTPKSNNNLSRKRNNSTLENDDSTINSNNKENEAT